MPASSCLTPTRAAIDTGTNENPRPTPVRMNPGVRSTRYEPPTEIWLKYSSPSAVSAIPVASTVRTPILVTSACDAPAETMITARHQQVADAGLDRRVAQHLLHVEREQEEHRENRRAQHQRDRVGCRLSDRLRKMPSGISGALTRRSVTDESDQQHGRGDEQADRPRSRPRVVDRLHQAVHQQRQAAGGEHAPPSRSNDRVPPSTLLSRRYRGAASATAMPTGTLMKKIHDQLSTGSGCRRAALRRRRRSRRWRPRCPEPCSAPAPSSKVVTRIDSAAGETIAAPDALDRAGGDQRRLGSGEAADRRRG